MILSLRTRTRFALASAVVLLSGCRESTAPTETKPLTALTKKQKRTAPGKFDFYVMSLSWSPGFCATPAGRNDDTQCGPQRHFAFVLHGLWPQYEKRGWPHDCGGGERPDSAVVDAVLPIMPSPKLVNHEWSKHGTCSGLSPKEYFDEAGEAFRSVKIPMRGRCMPMFRTELSMVSLRDGIQLFPLHRAKEIPITAVQCAKDVLLAPARTKGRKPSARVWNMSFKIQCIVG
jgi:ribonuclease I